jgi:hypothetical protein
MQLLQASPQLRRSWSQQGMGTVLRNSMDQRSQCSQCLLTQYSCTELIEPQLLDDMFLPTHLWQTIHLLPTKMGVLWCCCSVRDWFPDLWCCARLRCTHYWTSNRRPGKRRNQRWIYHVGGFCYFRRKPHLLQPAVLPILGSLLMYIKYSCKLAASRASTSFCGLVQWHVRHCYCCCAFDGGRLRHALVLEMVLLHQPAFWRYYPCCFGVPFRLAKTVQSIDSIIEGEISAAR